MRTAALLLALTAVPAFAQEPAPVGDAPKASTPPAGAASASGAAAPAPAAPTPAKPAEAAFDKPPLKAAAVLDEITGTVSGIDRKAHQVTITTAKGPVSARVDRNTLVYTQAGLGTVLDIQLGQPIRAGLNATSTAYWMLVRPAPTASASPAQEPAGPDKTPSTPGQGTGPGGGAGPAEGGAPTGTTAPPSAGPTGSGSATPGGP